MSKRDVLADFAGDLRALGYPEPQRKVVWFSCGAASAVAAKLAVEKYGDETTVVYCDTMKDEHPDNVRFFNDVQGWIGVPILEGAIPAALAQPSEGCVGFIPVFDTQEAAIAWAEDGETVMPVREAK